MKKPVKIGLWLLGFAVLAMLGLWLEHERAKARLEVFKAQLIAKGEKLAIADHVPKLPPALSNAAPDFIAAANRLTELKPEFQPQRMRMVAPGKARVTWQQPELPSEKEPDLWPFITAHREENRPLLAEMAVALERPEMVVNLDYTKGFNLLIPHLAKHKAAANVFANAVLLELRNEQQATALTNLLTAVRLTRLNEEPILISQLVRAACGHIAFAVTWEALQSPGWTDAQLQALQTEWQAWDTKRGWLAACNMERAIGLDIFAQCRANPETIEQLGGISFSSSSFWDALWNRPDEALQRAIGFSSRVGWAVWFSFEDERWTLNAHQVWLDGARQAHRADALAAPFARMLAAAKPLETPPRTAIMSHMLIPALDKAHKKFAMFETVRRLTFTAIALHRHRLKHGKFPESLGALVPEFLADVPRDFMDGQPLRYKLQPDGQFLLWSVGEDFKDDGGDPTTAGVPGVIPFFDWLKGRDWVWPQAATEAEVAAYHAELSAKRALSAPKPPP
ncbi:MAG: hypothetical protein ABMA26_02400 [Limisphaerales bacterium]